MSSVCYKTGTLTMVGWGLYAQDTEHNKTLEIKEKRMPDDNRHNRTLQKLLPKQIKQKHPGHTQNVFIVPGYRLRCRIYSPQ